MRPGLVVLRVIDAPREVLLHDVQGVQGPHVGDGVAALVGRAVLRVGRTRHALAVVDRRERLERVAEHVEAATVVKSPV